MKKLIIKKIKLIKNINIKLVAQLNRKKIKVMLIYKQKYIVKRVVKKIITIIILLNYRKNKNLPIF